MPGEAIAHRLVPAAGCAYLSPLIVAMRISFAFAYAEADEAAGFQRVGEIIRQLEAGKGFCPKALRAEWLEHLQKVRDRSVHACFGDDPGSQTGYLCTLVIPGAPLVFEYESVAHRRAVQPLLERCARILGYAIESGPADFAANLITRPGEVNGVFA